MLKTYLQGADAGGTPEFWESSWDGGSLEEALRFCEMDPLRAVFRRHLPEGGLVLEGGCGLGQYVVYYARLGYRMVGLDFTQRPLERLRQFDPGAFLCRGDVSRLPFQDETFDAYYSGGVVEHFEDGPELALAEARRVLKPSGVLIISVPSFNGVRRLRHLFGFRGAPADRVVERPRADGTLPDQVFFQYVFGRTEFRRRLEASGFKVIEARGTHVLWGAKELPLVGSLFEWATRRFGRAPAPRGAASAVPATAGPTGPTGADAGSVFRRYLKRALLEENDRALPLLPVLRRVSANMMVYVCVRDDG